MTESNRSSRLLEHVVVQEPSSPSPNSSRVDVAIELQDIYADETVPQKRERRRDRRRRRPKPWTIKYCQRLIRKLVRSKEWTIFMIIVIIYVLFVDDIVAMTKAFKGNGLFLGVGISKMIVLGIFIIEFIIQLFAMHREYNHKTLFFWLDIIAIGSLIPDVLILAYGSDGTPGVSTLAIARAGRAARASGRVARILRVSQFFTCFGFNQRSEEDERRDSDPPIGIEPSRMGNRLINRTTNKVVVIVLVLLFVSAFMQADLDATQFVRAGLSDLETLHDLGNTTIYSLITERFIAAQEDIIYLQVRGVILHEDNSAMDGIFPQAILKYKTSKSEAEAAGAVRSEVWYDNRDEQAREAGYSLGLLLLVIILLTIGNLLIIHDATRLVITPMERVLAILKQLSANKNGRMGRNGSGGGGGAGGARSSRDGRRSRDLTDTSDDLTSSSGMESDDEEEVLFGMLNDIDGTLQAAKERADMEAGENQKLRNRIMDLVTEKKLVELQVSGIKRRARTKTTSSSSEGASEVGMVEDAVEAYVQANKSMSRVATAARKVDFGLAIGGRKFMSYNETDTLDIRFSHPTPNSTPNPTPPPSPSPTSLREHRANSELEPVATVTLAGLGPNMPPPRMELPQVQVATVDRLVERLTYEEYTDAKFIHVFLLTYRSIISPVDLMERMLVRFCYATPSILLPKDAAQDTIEEWRKQKQEPIRIGVYNAMKLWIGRYFWDFQENQELLAMLNDFITYLLPETNMDRHAINMDTLFKAKTDEERSEKRVPYEPPINPTADEMAQMCAGDSELNLYEIEELAQQITLIEHKLFRAIKPNELLGQAWTKKNKERDSPNILRLIDHFNDISAWIKTQIVKCVKAKERANAIKRAISLSEEFLKLNNFNGAMEVLAALSNASVSRMKKTWALLPNNSQESFQELGQLMSSQSSFKLYRERLHTSPPPSIPYIGVYLSDLVFIDEGNPDTVESSIPSPLYNFDKHRQVAAVIIEIQKYQNSTYLKIEDDDESDEEDDGIEPNNEIIGFIEKMRGIDDDTAYKTSLASEPRARAGSSGIPLSPTPSFLQRLRNASPTSTL